MRATALTLLLAAVSCALAKHGESETGGAADDDDDMQSSTTSPSPSSSSPTSSSSSASPSPTAVSLFQFLPPSNATTCSNTTFQWQSANLSVPLTLTITNERATASGTPSGAGTTLVSRTLASNVSAAAGRFAWQRVDVPAGTYVAVAFDTARTAGVFVESPPFVVRAGSDSSCLASASSSNSQSSSTSGPTPTSGAASSSESPGGGSGAGAQEKSLSPGVLGGVVAGVVVGVLLLIMGATFPHYWKDALVRRRRNRHPGGPYQTF